MSWINQTISHYKILEKLGEGGMGVVYKARDTKLDRDVALKFLPHHITINEADKARFLQEAKAASAINHPNVCVIHDIQEHEGQQFIVMEYVDGVTLGTKIKSGLIPLKDVTNYAIQIAEALQEAHNNGIIHRDIKSDNIMVNHKNQIKVMDFGLAKLKGSLKLTKSTSTVGTLSYMAPEQIQGTDIDARSDIFSFGVVLYEMLTVHLPFRGDYETAMMYSILNEEPEPVQNYRTDLSSEYLHVLNRSLEKDPEDRYQNAHDIAIDLKRVLRDTKRLSRKSVPRLLDEELEIPQTKDNKKKYRKLMFKVIVPLVSMIVIFFVLDLLFIKKSTDKTTGTMTISKFTSYTGEVTEPAFSPDGNDIAFCWTGNDGKSQNLYVKTIGVREFEPRQITFDDMNDYHPTWSPNRKYIAFHRVDRVMGSFMLEGLANIYMVPANGGQERKLTFGWQPDWSPDSNSLVFCDADTVKRTSFISVLELQTLKKKVLVQPDFLSYAYYPVFSPDGKKVAFLRTSRVSTYTYPDELYIVSSSGGQPVQLTFDNADIKGLTWTPDSRNIVFSSNRGGTYALWKLSVENRAIHPISTSGGKCTDPKISPDGGKLCYIVSNSQTTIWSIDRYDITATAVGSKTPIKQTIIEGNTKNAEYSPDGQEIVFMSNRSGTREIWKCNKEGRSAIQLTSINGPRVTGPRWSPDGKWICFDAAVEENRSIFKVRAEGGPSIRLTSGFTDDIYPQWSCDGKWIYYGSGDYQKTVVKKILADAPLSKPKYVFDDRGLGESADGKYLYFKKSNKGNIALYKKSLQSGEESMVFCPKYHGIAERLIFAPYTFDLFDNGIYFLAWDEKNAGIVLFYDFETQIVNNICAVSYYPGNIDVSPDQKYLLNTRSSLEPGSELLGESDIWLIENFK